MLIIFFIAAVPKDSQRFQQRCASTFYFYAFSLRSVKGKAMQQHGSFAIPLFFLFDEDVRHFYKMKRWAYNAVAAATNTLII